MIKENKTLNLLRAIACIGVVLIHVPFPGNFGLIIKKIFEFAVPLFAMITGYYSYKQNASVICKRLKKIVLIFLSSLFIYTFFSFLVNVMQGEMLEWIKNLVNFESLLKLLIFCTVDYAIPLWYLIAMIEMYIFWFYVVKNKHESRYVKLLPLLFVIQFVSIIYCESNDLSWYLKINFVTRIMPWFLAGYYVAYKFFNEEPKLSDLSLILGIIVGVLIAIFPSLLKTNVDFSCLGYLPITLSLFILAIKYPNINCSNKVLYIGKKLSLYIYIVHPLVDSVIDKTLNILHFDNILYAYINPFVVIILSIILSGVIDKIINKLKKA